MEMLTCVCTRCKVEKDLTLEFFPPHNKKKNGFDSWCRVCRAIYRSEIRRGLYRGVISDKNLKEIIAVGVCTICGEPGDQVDHCHETGQVRGLLCVNCNTGLGKFKDDPDLLEFARIYLLVSRENTEGLDYLEKYGE